MKRVVQIFAVTILMMTMNASNLFAQETYESMWKEVEKVAEKDLPRQVTEKTQLIYNKARKEKNFPQMMKAWIRIVDTKSTIDADSFRLADIRPADYTTPTEEAIYNAIMGSGYLAMRNNNSIRKDKDSVEYYTKTGNELLAKSLINKKELAREKASDYLPLFTLGDDSRLYGHDLLSVLTRFAVERCTDGRVLKFYEEARDFYKQENNREAYTLMQLNCLNRAVMPIAKRGKALLALLEESKGLEAAADVAYHYAEILQEQAQNSGNFDSREAQAAKRDEFLAYVRNAQVEYKDSKLLNNFKRLENTMLHGSIRFFATGDDVIANRPFTFTLNYQNMAGVKLTIRQYNGVDKNFNLRRDGKLILEREYTFTNDAKTRDRIAKNLPYEGEFTDKLNLPADHYVAIMENGDVSNATDFRLSTIRLTDLSLPGRQHIFTVVDAVTGRPVKGATVYLTTGNNEAISLKCNDKGECTFTAPERKYYTAYAFVESNNRTESVGVSSYDLFEKRSTEGTLEIFTDRAIYRPGQKVLVSVMAYASDGDESEVMPFTDLTVKLNDANYQTVATQEVKTNEWGTAYVEFTIPKDRLPGNYQIFALPNDDEDEDDDMAISSPAKNIKVEEYKRPTFEVSNKSTDKEREIAFGDSVHVTFNAKSLTGVPVQGANVKYTLSSANTTYSSWYSPRWEEIESGELTTDDEGNAKVAFRIADNELNAELDRVVRYQLKAEITDVAGESHETYYYTAVSKRGFDLSYIGRSSYDTSKPIHAKVTAENASHQELTVSGTYTVRKRNAEKNDPALYNGEFTTNKDIVIPSLPMGTYTFEFKAKDSHGNEITESRDITLFNTQEAVAPGSKTDKARTDFDNDFNVAETYNFSEVKPAVLYFSPREDDAYVSYTIIANGKVVERKFLTLDRKLYKFTINYQRAYGDGICVVMGYVRNGHVYSHTHTFTYSKPDTNLRFTWKTFRDKLTPGQKETWVLTVKDKDGRPVNAAEMMATMYDASLDAFATNSWWFYNNRYNSIDRGYIYTSGAHHTNLFIRRNIKQPTWMSREFDELTSYFSYLGMRPVIYRNMRLRGASGGFGNGGAVLNEVVMAAPIDMEEFEGLEMTSVDEALQGRIAGLDIVMDSGNLGSGSTRLKRSEGSGLPRPTRLDDFSEEPIQSQKTIEMRSNFAETAFFYPHLLTDENGDVHISFTLPESLTRWKFMGFAHTKDVRYGNVDTTIVAKKDFMIQPNMPRFVREGDKVSIASRLVNQSETTQTTTVRFIIKDADTDEIIWAEKKEVVVEAGKTAQAVFNYNVSDRFPLLVCEITAESDDFTDGERNYLPVLSSKKYVTETSPFYVFRGENKNIDLNSLFNENSPTATQKRMVLEFTANPTWTVIEALEGIKLPEYDNAPCFAASLYANTMGQRIAAQIPGLHDILKSQTVESDSELSKDEELKDIVLKESPWLRDALKEKNQRAELIDFFDEQLMSQRISTAKKRLQHLQNYDGSWSWFDGMEGSYSITEAVVEDLILLASDDDEVKKMTEKGLAYLDKDILTNYKQLKRNKIKLYTSERILRYLYLSALMPDRKVSSDIKKMRDEYITILEKQTRTFTIYGKANGAFILQAFGRTKKAQEFLQSAIEYSITKPGMGRYYATDKAQYSWRDNKIPTHLAAMKAIRGSERTDRTILLADMQVWLLRQKQSQQWDSPMNTIGAIQFLLENEANETNKSHETNKTHKPYERSLPNFTLDGTRLSTPIDTTKFLAEQLGYVKTQVDNSLINGGIHQLNVQSTEALTGDEAFDRGPSSISWGAVYTQFNEELASLKNQSSGELQITRRIMKDGKDVTEPLHVGDKVTVRLTVKADRDMDFVQIRSQHPACFEPTNQLSGYRFMGGLGGYVARHDASTDVFFDKFRKGSVTYDLEFYVTRTGEYLAGIATAQCAYAPEFVAHTGGDKVVVGE